MRAILCAGLALSGLVAAIHTIPALALTLDTSYGTAGTAQLPAVDQEIYSGQWLRAGRNGALLFNGWSISEPQRVRRYFGGRLTPDGKLDTNFTLPGVFSEAGNLLMPAYSSLIERDDGTYFYVRSDRFGGDLEHEKDDHRLCLLAADGSLIPSFGTDGCKQTYPINPSGSPGEQPQVADVQQFDDGGLLYHGTTRWTRDPATIRRYDNDGDFDATFGDGAPVYPGVGIFGRMYLDNPHKRIFLTGAFFSAQRELIFRIVKFTQDGLPDLTFGSRGTVQLKSRDWGLNSNVFDLEVDRSGNIYIAAYLEGKNAGDKVRQVVFKLLPSGELAPTFGFNGMVTISSKSESLGGVAKLVLDSRDTIWFFGNVFFEGRGESMVTASFSDFGEILSKTMDDHRYFKGGVVARDQHAAFIMFDDDQGSDHLINKYMLDN